MNFTLRVDLDYVPWDTPDAVEFGHGEPAELLRMLDLAREMEVYFQFFVSNRVMRAFPSEIEAVLNDGHSLDWLCKHPSRFQERYAEGVALFRSLGHEPVGVAVKNAWPEQLAEMALPPRLKFLSSSPGPVPAGLRHFPVETRTVRDAFRSGQSARGWEETIKTHLRTVASVSKGATVSVRPQVLARYDPKLNLIRELLAFSQAIGMKVSTYRDLIY